MDGDGLKRDRVAREEGWIFVEESIFCAFRGIINFQRRKRASSPHRDTASQGGFSTMNFPPREFLIRVLIARIFNRYP
jgi:hypothetical protein